MRDLADEAVRDAAPPRSGPRARRWWFSPVSSLTRRIVFINMIGLGLLVAGVLYLNQFRAGLIELRAQALHTQGEIIAIAISEAAGLDGDLADYDPVRANFVLRRLAQPAGVRARLFDRRGRLTGDTRSFSAPAAGRGARPRPSGDARGLVRRGARSSRGRHRTLSRDRHRGHHHRIRGL